MRHYCTYFDRRYAAHGLALYRSLQRHAAPFRLHILCLDDECARLLSRHCPAEIRLIPLREVEERFPELRGAKADRQPVEYYFTLSPALPLYCLTQDGAPDAVAYVDADLFLYGSPEPLWQEFEGASVQMFRHHFEGDDHDACRRGKYNVGVLFFRADANAEAALRWWLASCVRWCRDEAVEGKYADQMYLDEFERRFGGVAVSARCGAHVGPWNLVYSNRLVRRGTALAFGAEPLIFFHFHGLRIVRSWLLDTGMTYSPLLWNRPLHDVYRRYAAELLDVLRDADVARAAVAPRLRHAEALTVLDRVLTRQCYVRAFRTAGRLNLLSVRNRLLRVRDAVRGQGSRRFRD
jgi:hypothetical protein